MIFSLGAALLIGAGLILPLTSVQAAGAAVTTISVYDQKGALTLAKVSVFNEHSGQQLANGLTDPVTGRFTFQSPKGIELIVTVLTSTGYLGAERVTPGDLATIVARNTSNVPTANVPFTFDTTLSAICNPCNGLKPTGSALGSGGNFGDTPGLNGADMLQATSTAAGNSGVASGSAKGVRSFYIDRSTYCDQTGCFSFNTPILDAAGSDSSKTIIAILDWETFEQVARGHANEKGQFTFDIPADMQSADFLTISWSADGAIRLLRTNFSNHTVMEWMTL